MIRPLTLAILLAVAAPPVAAKQAPAPDTKAALADPARPSADRERDTARKPAELLAFAGIKPGQKVGDFVMGGGYLTRILAGAVGPAGKVYAFQPAEFIAFKKQYGDDQAAIDAAYANVDAVAGPFAAPAFPEPLDAIITVQNFHDLYLKPFPAGTGAKASAALFAALIAVPLAYFTVRFDFRGAILIQTLGVLPLVMPVRASVALRASPSSRMAFSTAARLPRTPVPSLSNLATTV